MDDFGTPQKGRRIRMKYEHSDSISDFCAPVGVTLRAYDAGLPSTVAPSLSTSPSCTRFVRRSPTLASNGLAFAYQQ
jgi:hypothetical protein